MALIVLATLKPICSRWWSGESVRNWPSSLRSLIVVIPYLCSQDGLGKSVLSISCREIRTAPNLPNQFRGQFSPTACACFAPNSLNAIRDSALKRREGEFQSSAVWKEGSLVERSSVLRSIPREEVRHLALKGVIMTTSKEGSMIQPGREASANVSVDQIIANARPVTRHSSVGPRG